MRHAIEYREPPAAPPPQPPEPAGLWAEWRIGLALLRLGAGTFALRREPRGDGSTAILIPGWKGPEASMGPLRRYLAWLGHDARHWGFGTNEGDPERDSERMVSVVADLAARNGPVHLVGWSLGGVVARETARQVPQHVAQVVTFGTPAVGGPTYTLGARVWGRKECARIAQLGEALDRESPIRVPIAAIFTCRDEVVSWPACIDRRSPRVTHYEVGSTHIGMAVDPTVWSVIARRLAEPVRATATTRHTEAIEPPAERPVVGDDASA